MSQKPVSGRHKIIRFLEQAEDFILSSLLVIMILMAVLQILLRNLFDTGIVWADELIRVLVLWIGLVGAMVASRSNRHISIDVVSRYLPEKTKKAATIVTSLFTALVCAVMTRFSFSFVVMEKNDGLNAFAAVPNWVCQTIIPFSFAVISLRYFILSADLIFQLIKGEKE